MKILFSLGHPAHFHLFKHVIRGLRGKGHDIRIVIKKKDVLESLLQEEGFDYLNILPEGRKDSKTGIALGIVKRDLRLLRLCLSERPAVMIGTSVEICHVGRLLGIPTINVNEDDADVVPLYSKMSYPFAGCILSPDVCRNGRWENKSVKYNGYHELCYLHPNHFMPDPKIAGQYVDTTRPYYLVRFAKLSAHHDRGIRGLGRVEIDGIIRLLGPAGRICITSERPLEPEYEPYRLPVRASDMHHVMAFATMYIGDSQTMAAEAGVLGVPFIRYNDFVGRIGYLNDLEKTYELGFGIRAGQPEILFSTMTHLLEMPGMAQVWASRREKMLSEKIDSAAFMVNFIETYRKP